MVTAAKNTASGTGVRDVVKGRLIAEAKNLADAYRERAISAVADRMGSVTARLVEYAANGGGPGLISAVTGAGKAVDKKSLVKAGLSAGAQKVKDAAGGGTGKGAGKGQKLKVTNIVEEIDVGAPVSVCYNQWTRFTDFPTFMKKVENVEQESDETLNWKANILWSHRAWQSTIIEQVPDRRIVWRSEGEKGSVDGAVTFHELAPELTRIVLILEYNPKGFFEKTGNIWRAQGRRARLELKHFARHVMTEAVLHPDEIQGWRGEIHDGQVGAAEESDEDGAEEDEERAEGAEQRAEGDEDRAEGDEERESQEAGT